MQKRLIMCLLLLMIIPSLYTYYKYSQPSIDIAPIPSSRTQNIPKGRITKIFSQQYEGVKVSSLKTQNSTGNTVKKSNIKPETSLEIFGTVIDPSGKGIADVLIFSRGEFPPLYTDANGEYRAVFDSSEFTDLSLSYSRDGYEKQKHNIAMDTFKAKPKLEQNITLITELDTQTKTTINGKVSNLLGEGVANQRIHLITLGDYSANEVRYIIVGFTDENGYFSIENVSINTRYQLLVLEKNGYASNQIDDFLVTDDILEFDIFLEDINLTSISGQVIDREGVPLPNIAVNAKNNASDEYNIDFVTDAAGEFQLEGFPEGEVSFYIESPAEIEVTGIKLSGLNSQNIILPINIGNNFVSGIVTNEGGEYVQDALVTLQSTYSENNIYSHSIRTKYSDSTGAFEFEGFSSDRHFINVASEGLKKKTIVYEPNLSDTNLNIVLEGL